ncbi:MAG: heat-inducible transcriptional repressor HrcA [Myxococcaceae bacterium]|nr:heat-inducible transcriptional repressor HrcA [Myxococcaceae bacterium]
MAEELGERAREVLRAVIHEYITTGDPVGSHQLVRSGDFDVSSATLRNVLKDLEDLGFIEKPHTSAGRVPTDRGYRFYVDALVRLREPLPRERELIQANLTRERGMEERLLETGRLLHVLTRHAVVVLVPRPDDSVLERVEFIRLREDRVLAVLIGRDGQVHNKAITVDFPITSDELLRAGNYLSSLLREVSLEQARQRIQVELEQERALYDVLSAKALKLGIAAITLDMGERVLIEGTGSFLQEPDADLTRMRAIFRALEEKRQLLTLLDEVQRTRELQIFIGTESEFSSAGDVSVIATPYGTGETVLGAVGVIGPTRMNYQRVIPLVSFTAQVLSRGLAQG